MRDGHYEVYIMDADGSNQTRITTTTGQAIDPDWKPEASLPVAPLKWGRLKQMYR
jgi:Tol biopolymer transport system component